MPFAAKMHKSWQKLWRREQRIQHHLDQICIVGWHRFLEALQRLEPGNNS